jgi:hypothetical protein
MRKSEREPELIRLWEQRSPEKRSMNDVCEFTGWLFSNRPELLSSARYGDPYQQMKSALRGRIRES